MSKEKELEKEVSRLKKELETQKRLWKASCYNKTITELTEENKRLLAEKKELWKDICDIRDKGDIKYLSFRFLESKFMKHSKGNVDEFRARQ